MTAQAASSCFTLSRAASPLRVGGKNHDLSTSAPTPPLLHVFAHISFLPCLNLRHVFARGVCFSRALSSIHLAGPDALETFCFHLQSCASDLKLLGPARRSLGMTAWVL